MTKEEAIKQLKDNRVMCINSETEPFTIAYDLAIKALETLEEFEKAQIITGSRLNGRTYAYKCGLEDGKRKALEQEPHSFKWCETCKEYDQEKHCCHRYSKVIRDTVAEIRQEPRKGHWIMKHYIDKNRQGFNMWVCSNCYKEFSYDAETGVGITDAKYCPMCGIKMEVEDAKTD